METIRNVDVDAINHKIYILFMELLDKIEQGYYEDYQDILDLICLLDVTSDAEPETSSFIISYSDQASKGDYSINILTKPEIRELWET